MSKMIVERDVFSSFREIQKEMLSRVTFFSYRIKRIYSTHVVISDGKHQTCKIVTDSY